MGEPLLIFRDFNSFWEVMVWKALSVLAALVALSSSLEGESKGYHKFDHLNIKPYDKFKDPLIDNPRQADG